MLYLQKLYSYIYRTQNQLTMKLPKSVYNWTSVIGATIAIIAIFMIGFLFTISFFFDQGSSYLGLVIYMVLPVFVIAGLLLIPLGMWGQRKRDLKSGETTKLRWPHIDFNESRNRNAFLVFTVGSTIFLLLSAVGSYEAFHYSESVEFCGTLCHEVMEPEYVAYQNSPHARVSCVDCHVGSGADWYVRSKMSGMYQVYAVTTNIFPRPIPTPVANLRPARETCERCHWPEKFYAQQNRLEKYYMADEENTEWDISLQIKTGPGYSALGLSEGIHWHINPDIEIEYKASSADREFIPWVKYTNKKTGEIVIYEDKEDPLSPEDIATIESRTMDCMDCHNRPSHNYLSPSKFVDNAMTAKLISTSIPDFKMLAMGLLHEEYPTKDSALKAIDLGIREYYESTYPDFMDNSKLLIENAIVALQGEFQKNIFPAMKVRWDAYPNHIGHMETNGCFRCHDDKHQSKQQKNIAKDCNLCHIINAQGNPGNMETAMAFQSLEFKHPVDIDEDWKVMNCSDCHSALY